MDLGSASSKSKLLNNVKKRAASLSRQRKGTKDKASSLSSAADLRISGPTNYRNCSVTGLFGVRFEQALKEHEAAGFQVPPFIEQICLHIEQTMLHREGMFRVSAKIEVLEKCRNTLNDGKTLDLWQLDDLVVCDLLKLYLRQLPEPLLTFELYDCFLAKAKAAIRTAHPVELQGLVDLLPKPNQRVLKRIVQTLRKVSQYSALNKMNEDNLGLIFGPNLLRAPPGPDEQLLEDFAHVNGITLSLIKNYDSLFAKVDYSPHYKCYVRALYDFEAKAPSELQLAAGEVVMVIEQHDSGWWLGEVSYGGGGDGSGQSSPHGNDTSPSFLRGSASMSSLPSLSSSLSSLSSSSSASASSSSLSSSASLASSGEIERQPAVVRRVGYFPATYCAYLNGRNCQANDDENAWESNHVEDA